MPDLFPRLQQFAEFVGPNVYAQALIYVIVGVLIGKIADLVISRVIGRIAQRSATDFDDLLIERLHRPVFLTFVLIGLGLATIRIGLPTAPEFFTLALLKTLATFVWSRTLTQMIAVVVTSYSKAKNLQIVQSGMLSLLHNRLVVTSIYWLRAKTAQL